MSELSDTARDCGHTDHFVEVAGKDLTFRPIPIDDPTPTGAQLAAVAGFKPGDGAIVWQMLPNGELEDIRPTEVVKLRTIDGRFVIVPTDRQYLITIEGQRYPWPCRIISGAVLRKLGRVPIDQTIYLEQADEPDQPIGGHDLVDLDGPGVESFVSRKLTWGLLVQGVQLEIETPTIQISDALVRAGFNPNQGWHIFLKVAGEKKREVPLTEAIDLRTPGIEKLRLTPKVVNNGEAPPTPRRDFCLLDADETYLARISCPWETVVDGKRRWLLIHHFSLPPGYTVEATLLALEIPQTYPGAQIDSSYTNPPLSLKTGNVIPATHLSATICSTPFNGWSRHRGPESKWNPATDNVSTHLVLVESALAKEVGE